VRRHLEVAFKADRTGLMVRWLLIPMWAILGYGSIPLVILAVGIGLYAVLGILTQRKLKDFDSYLNGSQAHAGNLRLFDLLTACCAAIIDSRGFSNVWLLAVPSLLFDGLSTRNAKRVAFLTIMGVGIIAYGAIMAENLRHAFIPALSLGISGVTGIALAKFQTKERFLEDRDRRLTTLMNTASSLASSGDLRGLIVSTLKSAVQDLGATAGIVTLTSDEDPGLLITGAAYCVHGDFHFPVVIGIGDGVSGYVAQEGQPIALTANGTGFVDVDGIGIEVKSAVSVPLINRNFSGVGMAQTDSVMGAITIVNSEFSNALEAEELDVLQSLASLMANAIHNARMEEKQRATFIRTMESLATALEARDEYTRGHSQRVCDLSVMLGSKLGLMQDALEELRIGTVLHDIGKIGVPDSIIRNHHEKLDGSGYPDGLKGGELPLSLRIVCVADAFDAMSSRRPYRGVMDMAHVVGELSKGAGTQFDSVVVEALKGLLYAGSLDELYAAYWNTSAHTKFIREEDSGSADRQKRDEAA